LNTEYTDWSESKGKEPRIVEHDNHSQHLSLHSVDADYRFGRPKVYLAPHELARLTILRSRLGETTAERQARAAGLPLEIRRSPS
jgi:hypothetical protein